MCAIVGVFHHAEAVEKVLRALALLQNRGKDGCGLATPAIFHARTLMDLPRQKSHHALGHLLHAVVENVPQPLQGQGILAANCEIYNWQGLNEKYKFNATNDAEVLLRFLDAFLVKNDGDKLKELDGVYAFAYWNDNTLYLARDLLGEKPLWYSHNIDSFAFASEKKALEKIGFVDIQELNPRQILVYEIKDKKLTITQRPFFTYLPEHQYAYEKIKQKTALLLANAIQKRIPEKKFGLLFSGGVDSTFIAHHLKQQGCDFTCYTAALDSETPAADLIAAQKAAQEVGLKLKIRTIKLDEIPAYLKKIVPLIEDSNVVKVGVALTFYLACELAKKDGCKVLFSGLGSEEIFAGYERHKQSGNINRECVSGLLKMYERDLYRDDVITMHHGVELRLPFLDTELVDYALKIPSRYKIKDDVGKWILRDIALGAGLPQEIALRKKTAAQYGSRLDQALGKLAKKNKFTSKSAYLRTFYPTRNLKLGVLFSSGKDSTYAAYIMQKQNYELACLITMRSKNPDSYMFQSAGVEMVKLQAEAMGLPLLIQETLGEKEKELADLETALEKAKEKYHLDGVVSGALFSTYQRDRIERICDKLGLKVFAPLWHKPQENQLSELLQAGFRFIFTQVAAEGLDKTWLNRIITEKDIEKLKELQKKYALNVAGEGGEFESVVLDCPLFRKKIIIEEVEVQAEKDNVRLMIRKAKLEAKNELSYI